MSFPIVMTTLKFLSIATQLNNGFYVIHRKSISALYSGSFVQNFHAISLSLTSWCCQGFRDLWIVFLPVWARLLRKQVCTVEFHNYILENQKGKMKPQTGKPIALFACIIIHSRLPPSHQLWVKGSESATYGERSWKVESLQQLFCRRVASPIDLIQVNANTACYGSLQSVRPRGTFFFAENSSIHVLNPFNLRHSIGSLLFCLSQ